MSQWVFRGIATGIKSTRYPRRTEIAPGISPGLPAATRMSRDTAEIVVDRCSTGALKLAPAGVDVNLRGCVHCLRCARGSDGKVNWRQGYEWAGVGMNAPDEHRRFGAAFTRSVHVLVVDTGDCGACLNEVKLLNNPYYNMHRLGFFFTPTPRHADVLLVLGALSEHMRLPLRKAYDAMPAPKKVVAVGACALSGGVFGHSFACGLGPGDILPIDVEVPGNPPPPLAILHGLLVATRQKAPVALTDELGRRGREL
jgi:Ni,Fe-hydrogenase III small subunit